MAKCLVTGASGFIGTHLVPALVARGDDVSCLVRRTSKLSNLQGLSVRFQQGDITDPESLAPAMADVDAVYHLAGLTKALSVEQMIRANAGGIQNLMEAAARLPNPPVMVYVSSLAAAGPAVGDRPLEPQDLPRPVSHYGRSKLMGEIAAARLAGRVPLSIVRPPIVIGESDLLALDLFYNVSAFHVHLVPGFRPTRYSVIHAQDLAQAIILAAERGKRVRADDYQVENERVTALSGEGIYYAADEEMPTFSEVGQLIARGLGRKRVTCIRTPHAAAWVLAAISEGVGKLIRKPMSLNLDKVREAIAGSWICSPASAEAELGFRPAAPLSDRFQQTAEWYAKEGWL
jgi:nucleoside-diphosphate-sugar epimerase